jgi:hypothetical protein
MSEAVEVLLRPIVAADVQRVAAFLHRNLNPRVSASSWARAVVPPWPVESPNHGFLLEADGAVVGVHLAFYSERCIAGLPERFCNLAAWCVLEQHHGHSLRLLRALLAQPGYHFTDLSPSGSVVAINQRLKFDSLDTTTALIPNLPWPSRSPGARVISDPVVIAETLTGEELRLFQDHANTAAARHLVLVDGDEHCYVVWRKDRRKNLPLFASILHVGNPSLFRRNHGAVCRHLLLRHGALATLAEYRIVGFRPQLSAQLSRPRPKMFRSAQLDAENIDYLYSELVCVAW